MHVLRGVLPPELISLIGAYSRPLHYLVWQQPGGGRFEHLRPDPLLGKPGKPELENGSVLHDEEYTPWDGSAAVTVWYRTRIPFGVFWSRGLEYGPSDRAMALCDPVPPAKRRRTSSYEGSIVLTRVKHIFATIGYSFTGAKILHAMELQARGVTGSASDRDWDWSQYFDNGVWCLYRFDEQWHWEFDPNDDSKQVRMPAKHGHHPFGAYTCALYVQVKKMQFHLYESGLDQAQEVDAYYTAEDLAHYARDEGRLILRHEKQCFFLSSFREPNRMGELPEPLD